jgi:hypothetical protein
MHQKILKYFITGWSTQTEQQQELLIGETINGYPLVLIYYTFNF